MTNSVQWDKLFNVTASFLVNAVGGHLADSAISAILNQLVQVHSEEMQLLDSIQRDIKGLVEGPYNAGIAWLQEAEKPQRTSTERLDFIIRARDKFIDAFGQEQDLFRRALIQYHIGLCWLMLGNMLDARDWLESSYSSAFTALEKLNKALFEPTGFEKAMFDWSEDSAKDKGGGAIFEIPTGLAGVAAAMINQPRRSKAFQKSGSPIYSFMQSLLVLRSKRPELGLQLREVPASSKDWAYAMKLLK